ncbi:clustered mitochondria protein, partial [Tanacetum coccineum]
MDPEMFSKGIFVCKGIVGSDDSSNCREHSITVCQEAKELIETGKVQLVEGMLNEAYTLFTEAFTILHQVTGPMHREVANCCRYLAVVLYHAGDMVAAIMQQHKELIINERCLGLDHPGISH